jgi:zinc protease
MLTFVLLTAAATAGPAMPKLALPQPTYAVDGAEVCFASGLLVQAVRVPGTGMVAVATTVGGGTSAETDATRGAAHLVEHLWFRSRPEGGPAVNDRLEGLQRQGSTYPDATVYTTIGPAADLKWLLAMEGARLLDPLAGITDADLAAEREIVASELNSRGEHGDRAALRWLDASLWPDGHAYGSDVTPVEAANAVDLEDARTYAKAAYLPRNTSVRIEGDFDWNALQGILEAGLPDAVRAGTRPGCARKPSAEPPPAPRATSLRKEEAPVWKPRLYVAWSLPAAWGADDMKMRIAVDTLEKGVWKRIPWVKGVGDAGDIAVGCDLVPGKLASEAVCVVELPEGADLDGTWKAILAELPNQWAPSHAQARRERIAESGAYRFVEAFSEFESHGSALEHRALSTWLGRVDPLEPLLQQIGKVDEPGIAEFAKKWLGPDRAVGVALVPTPGKTATGSGWAGKARLEASAAPKWQIPAPATGGLRTEVLANGLDVWILHRPESAYLGLTSLVAPGGWANSPAPGATEVIDTLQTYQLPVSLSEIRREVGLHAGISMGSMAAERDTVGPAGVLDLQLWLQRTLLDTLEMDFSARQSALDPQVESAFVAFQSRPSSTSAHLRTAWLLGSDRAGQPWWEGVRAARYVAQKDVLAWERTLFRPENAALLVVGPTDPAQVKTTAEAYLGGWKGKGAPVTTTIAALPAAPERKVYVMQSDAARTDLAVTCRVPARTDENAAAYDVLDGVLERGLWQTLREDGHIYGYSHELTFVDRRVGLLTIRARTAPEDAVPALKATFDLLRLVHAGVSDEVLANGRLHARGLAASRFATAEYAWYTLAEALQEGRSAASLSASPDAVTAQQVRGLLSDCFGHEAATFVGARPPVDGLPVEDVDWKTYGATLAKSLQ